jgi:ferredoxin
MRIHLNEQGYGGQGRCHTVAPSVFEADNECYPGQRGHDVDVAPGEEDWRLGMANCPDGAITVRKGRLTGGELATGEC